MADQAEASKLGMDVNLSRPRFWPAAVALGFPGAVA